MITSFSLFGQNSKNIGQIITIDPDFQKLIAPTAKIEVLASGFNWSEGPVWNKADNCLYFSDVPENKVYRWKEGEEVSVFLEPSGFTGLSPYSLEPGSNGLIINNKGELVSCEHGDRRLSILPLQHGGKYTLADNWQGKRFNSPNDLVQAKNGTYYFTDPPYGLPDRENAKTREIDLFGVYKVNSDRVVHLVISNLTRPNGVALSPDEKILYVAQSDPEKAIIMSYPILENGNLGKGKMFYDTTPMVKQGLKGLPDGIKTDINGNVFSTGPGGILVFNPKGKLLGRIDTGEATANCNWGNDGSYLYITADMYLCRIKTNTIGKGFD